jgi:ABC-2 type transport system permease protein
MGRLYNISWLGTKELRSLLRDTVIVVMLIYSFTVSVYTRATGISSDVHNASIGLVDEDRSPLSRQIAQAFYPPYSQAPQRISADAIDPGMDQGRFMFVLNIPPRFEADVMAGRQPDIQVLIDGAGFAIVWPEFVLVAGLGLVCFLASLGLFRRSMTRST